MPISTRKAPSARTVGDFRQLLVFLQISHPPAVYILVLEVQYCLHTRPSSVTVVSGGLSLGAYQHPAGTQWGPQCPNWSGFPSVTGVSASLASTCALHIGAGSVELSAQMALLCAWGG